MVKYNKSKGKDAKMKKSIVIILACLSVVSCFAGCVNNNSNNNDVTDTGEVTSEEAVDVRYEADLPDEKFSGEFKILCEGAFWSTDADLFYEEASDDPVLNGVWRRCDKMKNQFGVDVVVTPSADTTAALKNSVIAGDKAYDAVVARMDLIASSAANGDLMDLREADGIDLEKLYWDQSANEKLSIANKLYYTVGDIITTEDACTWTMLFNKKLANNLDLEDLYEVVKKGRWTFDYFYSTMKNSNIAKPNDDGTWDHLSTYAFSTHRDMAYGFFYAAGLSFVKKDANDIPYVDAKDNEKIQNVLDYSLKVMRDTKLTIDAHKWTHIDPWATLLTEAAFREDRALFYAEVLQTIISLRSMDTDFGILPMPKYDEKQENYVTYVNPAASLVGIPIYQKNSSNARRSGILLEAMAYYGHLYIMPEYIEKAIKGKSTRDVKSIEMLEILFKNRMYDLGLINNWSNFASGYSDLVFNNSSEFSKLYKRVNKAVGKKIDSFLSKIVD